LGDVGIDTYAQNYIKKRRENHGMETEKLVSLILPCFRRADLLDLGLYSISTYIDTLTFPLEIIVINDGIEDETKSICDKYNNKLNIKYYFSGQRNSTEIKPRCPAWAINIGVKKCSGDIIVLSCPEVWHVNDALNLIIAPILTSDDRIMTTVRQVHFDDRNYLLPLLQANRNIVVSKNILNNLVIGNKGNLAAQMPFLLGLPTQEFLDIGGYDEDFIGYAGDDNDFIYRLLDNGIRQLRTNADIVHLYHGGSNINPGFHHDNPSWVYNWNLFTSRRGIIKRNVGRSWGAL